MHNHGFAGILQCPLYLKVIKYQSYASCMWNVPVLHCTFLYIRCLLIIFSRLWVCVCDCITLRCVVLFSFPHLELNSSVGHYLPLSLLLFCGLLIICWIFSTRFPWNTSLGVRVDFIFGSKLVLFQHCSIIRTAEQKQETFVICIQRLCFVPSPMWQTQN